MWQWSIWVLAIDGANVYRCCAFTLDSAPYLFNRIGQYDFTKTEQLEEIKRLTDGYGDGYVLYKGMTPADGIVDNGWVSIGVLSNKINELVDAVNELRKERT